MFAEILIGDSPSDALLQICLLCYTESVDTNPVQSILAKECDFWYTNIILLDEGQKISTQSHAKITLI